MRTSKRYIAVRRALLGLAIATAPCVPASAQDSWSPFRQGRERRDDARPPRSEAAAPLPPAPTRERTGEPAYQAPAPWTASRGGVERRELAPVMAPDASGLPLDLWRGLDLKSLEELLAALNLPPRSPGLHQLWRRMLLSSAPPPAGAPDPEHFVAVRLEALYRSGLLAEMEAVLNRTGARGPVLDILRARRDIGLGRRREGCTAISTLSAPSSGLPVRLKGEMQLLAGYCAAVAGDAQAAGLAADLAREEGLEAELPLAVLAGVASDTKPKLALPQRVLLLDYRFLELLGPVNAQQVFDKAEPALLAMLAGNGEADASLQIAAAEAALRLNAIAPDAMAQVYRGRSLPKAGHIDPAVSDPLLRRALFFQAVEAARTPAQRARFLHALLGDARRSGFALQMAAVIAPLASGLSQSPDVAWFAETGLELALVAGDFDQARRWAHSANLQHWQGLIDLLDPARRGGRIPSLAPIEDLAANGRLSPDALHRLATVLDALDIDVPIALWDAASRTPQPASGYLPETGVLADLAQSTQRRDGARAILLVMRSLGPGGAEAANVLALGDAIRALKRIGLEADARRLALEALLGVWPRLASN